MSLALQDTPGLFDEPSDSLFTNHEQTSNSTVSLALIIRNSETINVKIWLSSAYDEQQAKLILMSYLD